MNSATFFLSSGHLVVARIDAVGQWVMSVWAADLCIGSAYGHGPMPAAAVLASKGDAVVSRARLLDAEGV